MAKTIWARRSICKECEPPNSVQVRKEAVLLGDLRLCRCLKERAARMALIRTVAQGGDEARLWGE